MGIKELHIRLMGSRVELYKQVATRLSLLIGFSFVMAHAQPQAPVGSLKPSLSAESTAATTAGVQSSGSREYLISPEDVLDVYIYDVPELSRDYVVNIAGTVTVPLLPNPIQAAGLTTEEFARELEQSFRQTGRLSRPQITVAIKQSRRSTVIVEGAVKSPQVVPVIGPTRLVSIIAQCGGLADDAGSTATITRSVRGSSEAGVGPAGSVVTVELRKLMDVNDPMAEAVVYPGDRISVAHAGVFYVLGEVNRPGGYNLKNAREQVTILEALSIAGDVTSVAKKSQVKIIRKDATAPSGRRELAVNVDDILIGRSRDQTLQANDILFVPVSHGKRALHTLAATGTAIAGSAGTAAVYGRY
jgi:polysaccharide biosynthesis/export protein